MTRQGRIFTLAEEIREILVWYPSACPKKLRKAAERQMKLSAVTIFENLCSSLGLEPGDAAREALQEARKALHRATRHR